MKERKSSHKSKRPTKKILSIFALSSMFLNVVIPHSYASGNTAEAKLNQQNLSSNTFDAKEVNRILDGLTPEQKANINKLTGADNTEKIRVDKKDLIGSKKINVIVQFKQDPAKIQIIKQSLANGGATANTQAFNSEYTEAINKVKDSHANFKSFLNSQPKTTIVGGKSVNSSISISREFTDAFNGVALTLPANLVQKLAESPDVASVWSQVEYSLPDEGNSNSTATSQSVGKPTSALSHLGIDKLQAEGNTGIIKTGPRAGQKIKVGVLDTGIDYNHPDLYKVTHDENGKLYGGHDFVNNDGFDARGNIKYVDDHDPMETTYDDWVADKANSNPVWGTPPSDYKPYITSHGTHVSGTIAANTTNNNDVYSANGVAPDVALYGYRVLGPGGHGTTESVLSGIDQATKDHMDVINLSLGANVNDPFYPTSIAINNATLAGVVCDVAAGNAGPGQATVGSPGSSALAITVGASTVPEEIATMTVKNGSVSYKSRLFGKNYSQADDVYKGQTLPIVDVGLGSEADYSGIDVKGKLVLVKRGVDYLQTKMTNAKNAGAAGMIIWDNTADTDSQGYIPNFLGVSMDNVYSISLTQEQGQALSDAIKKDPKSANITFPSTLDAPITKRGDELASFSSTGPVKDWTIKPDVVAPGVDISSTAPYDIWEPNAAHDYKLGYQIMSGTSMATPHVAGISALVLAAHPDYTPADVKTALMNTAKDINTDSKTYSVYQVGAGRVDPSRAIKENVKIQVLDKTVTFDNLADNSTAHEVDNITGSMFFGFKGRGEGETNGSDDVVSSKDFNVSNEGTSSKTFNVSTEFITSKFAGSNKVGPGTGNDVKIDFSVDGNNVKSINVGGGSTVKATAKITVPSNSLEGTYEGYIHLINAADSSETYRIPFTITVAEKGINTFNVAIKAAAEGNISAYNVSFNNEMENLYIVVKDKDGKYIGVTNTLSSGRNFIPGVQYGPLLTLFNGWYLPFTKTYDGTYDKSGIADKVEVLKEGSYSLEMIATGKDGKRYTAEDTVYVDGTPPTMTMDSDSKPGIYEIDTTGYLPGQEIKGFHGTVYDSNVDVMKNNGETSVPRLTDGKPVPVDQGLNIVTGYQDSQFPTVYFNTNAKGRFHFGVTKEDVANKLGSDFIIDPTDYSGENDYEINQKTYYFIKKGNPYVTLTSSNGVDAGPGNEDKVVVDPNKPFKTTIATKYGVGMTGGKFLLNDHGVYQFSNIRLTDEYKNYLISKGIDPTTVLTVGQPYTHQFYQIGKTTDITISNIGSAGALDHDMPIIEADVTYTNLDPVVGEFPYDLLQANLTLSGTDTRVAWFPVDIPYVRQFTSLIRGRVAAESFARNNINNNYPQFTVDSGAKVTATDANGKKFTTDQPTTANNTMAYAFINPYYALTADVSDKPYSLEASVPGHFKGYAKTPVIGQNKFGYQSGTVKDLPGIFPILLGGDVNSDDVIDMKDLLQEISVYYQYKNILSSPPGTLNTVANKTAFLNTNRNADIYWIKPTGFGYGIDYNDFYFIFKNFGTQNQSAIDAGLNVPAAQLTVDKDTTITTDYAGSITLNAGDTLQQVMQKLNFAAPAQAVSSTPKLEDLQNGATISLSPSSTMFVDDVVWRKAITKVMLGSTDVTDKVTISPAYTYYDANGVSQTMPSKITLPGTLFPTATNYTITVKATGYQDVTKTLTVSTVPIPTPAIPIITDPTVAHIGNDLTLSFQEDANWRNGINKVIITTNSGKTVDITNLINPDTNQKYYDISKPGKITFNAKTFMTDSTLDPKNTSTFNQATINPGGKNYLPQLYKFTIGSTGTDGTVYPDTIAGSDPVYTAQQPVGYSITFDSQDGSAPKSMAVGYKPNASRSNGPNSDLVSFYSPAPTRPGYKFLGWYNEPSLKTVWDAGPVTADKTVYAKWQMNTTQSYSPVDKANPDGLKFDGSNGGVSGVGWILGEGDLKINIPDYLTNVSWLTSKDKIANIEATFYQMKSDGSTETTPTVYTLDPSTYDLTANGNNGILSFKTATHDQAVQAGQTKLGEKFAFSEMPTLSNAGAIVGYNLKLTSSTGEVVTIPNIQLGYRRHIDLNGGSLKNAKDLFFADTLVNGLAKAPNMITGPSHVVNGNLTISSNLYLDAANSSDKISDISMDNGKFITDNTTYYLCWNKVPPMVNKDVVGNIVGSDITLTFNDNGTWKNNIKAVKIGAKTLELNKDYTISNNSITLKAPLFTNAQKFNVTIVSEGYIDVNVVDQVVGYTVTFNSNGGDPVPSQIVDRSATKPFDPSKAGYKFYGWYIDQDLTIPYDFDNIVTKPITLYAKYALAGSFVTADTTDNAIGNNIVLEYIDKDWANAITGITLNGLAIDGSKYTVDKENRTITLDKSLFSRARDYQISIKATDYADVSLVQKLVNGYNVHFVVPGDAPAEVKEATKDQIVARRITAPTVHGYELTWFADQDCTIPWDFTNSIYSAKTLYGKWKPAKYTVIYDTQDAGLVVSAKVEYNTLLDETKPTRTGYTFLGWYKDAEGKTPWNFATDKVSGDMVLYAKWSINSYSIHFNSNGGSQVADKTANYNSNISLPKPTRTGYTFVGWYTDAALKTPVGPTVTLTNNITLYAKWSINSYSIHFNSNGGNQMADKTANYNSNITLPKPTRTGYTFVGWYKDAALKTSAGSTVTLTSNITLYAKWNINKYTVKFNSVGGTISTRTVNYNSTISQPASPTRKGYTFLGWYKDASGKVAWNFAKDQVTTNTTIYAKWVANPAKPTNVKLTKSGLSSVKLTWSSVSGAAGYEIVKSTSKTGTFAHLTNVTKTTYTNSGLTKGKTYYYKVRSYKLVGSKKVYSDWTSVIVFKR